MDALSGAAVGALELLGEQEAKRVFTTIGCEQEYFLIDEQYYFERPDLLTTGRTLFGAKPPKGHELDDHYFGSIPERILATMLDTERELGKLGVPVKTRHNEVAPNQYEIAPTFENSNVGADHQMLTMQIMQNTARRYGLVCLLHEKPYAGVNGSGKHNNWSMGTDTGLNLLDPGDTPHDNLVFLFFCTAVIQAVNKYQALLRASVADAGQDHRLGANEAPPAIISIFLGDELQKVYAAIETGKAQRAKPGSFLGLGTPVLPALPLHGGDRNRTSPFAFTGQKFEFRTLGSSSSPAFPNTVLNTIVAESIDELAGKLRTALKASGATLEKAVAKVVKESWTANKQIVFDGDNYTEEWQVEAEKRGLANLRTTPDALPWLTEKGTVALFKKYKVLSKRELEAREEVFTEQYSVTINIEARGGGDDRAHDADARRDALSRRTQGHRPRGADRGGRARPQGAALRAAGARGREPRRQPARHQRAQVGGIHARPGDPRDGGRARGGRPPREARRGRPLAAAEVLGDAVHQVAPVLAAALPRRRQHLRLPRAAIRRTWLRRMALGLREPVPRVAEVEPRDALEVTNIARHQLGARLQADACLHRIASLDPQPLGA